MGFWTRQRPADSVWKAGVGSASKSHLRSQCQGSLALPQSSCQSSTCLCQVWSTSLFLFGSFSLLSAVTAFNILTNVFSLSQPFCYLLHTYIESCRDYTVILWHCFTKRGIFSRLSQPCWRKSEASTTGREQITHRSPALHCMGSCEPSGRKQQRKIVRKLLLGMKKWGNERERQREERGERRDQ